MNSQQRIFIVGRAGAGKGVATAAVAKKLAWLNVNTDWALEASVRAVAVNSHQPLPKSQPWQTRNRQPVVDFVFDRLPSKWNFDHNIDIFRWLFTT
mgnify:CR=1 FL=1